MLRARAVALAHLPCRLLLRVHGLVAPRQLALPTWRNQARANGRSPVHRNAILRLRFATARNSAGSRGARRLLDGVDPMAPDLTAQSTAQSSGGSTMRRIVPGVLMFT